MLTVVVIALCAPLSFTVAPPPAADGPIVPEILNAVAFVLDAVKFTPATLLALMVSF